MKKLIVSATKQEVNLLLSKGFFEESKDISGLFTSESLDVLISGIGSVFTCFYLTNLLNKIKYDLVINVGIAGSYNKEIKLSELVLVKQDIFADLGIDDNGVFKTFEEEAVFEQENIFSATKNIIELPYKKLNAITVNTASGSNEKIEVWKQKFNPDIESMEGAAVFLVCNRLDVPVIQVRAISNYVEPRDKSKWKINEAFLAIDNFITSYLIPKK